MEELLNLLTVPKGSGMEHQPYRAIPQAARACVRGVKSYTIASGHSALMLFDVLILYFRGHMDGRRTLVVFIRTRLDQCCYGVD